MQAKKILTIKVKLICSVIRDGISESDFHKQQLRSVEKLEAGSGVRLTLLPRRHMIVDLSKAKHKTVLNHPLVHGITLYC